VLCGGAPGVGVSLLCDVRFVLFAHAHPDDETISSGSLILELVARGIRVALLTATRGEQGEVVPARRGLIRDAESLTRVREAELRDAAQSLGVSSTYLLGAPPARAGALAPRRYRDSGMRWIRPGLAGPVPDVPPDALCAAPLPEVVADVGALLQTVRPDLVISYDDNGGYGHPDHRRIRAAAERAAAERGLSFAELVLHDSSGVEWFETPNRLAEVRSALACHSSQLTVDGDEIVHSGGQREPIRTSVGLRRLST
jgi:N-acetyl-1-D-myo-inositol-2-amino-2-deoxy-alpha-D-glucopyranoside deacetylase